MRAHHPTECAIAPRPWALSKVSAFLRGACLRSDALRYGALLWLVACDLVAAVLLGIFAISHIRLVLRNQTSMHPFGEDEYDVGGTRNWRAVFGKRWSALRRSQPTLPPPRHVHTAIAGAGLGSSGRCLPMHAQR